MKPMASGIRDNKLFLMEWKPTFFYFKHDYYWVLSIMQSMRWIRVIWVLYQTNLSLVTFVCWKSNDPGNACLKTIGL
jgi:hypothetical protein